MKILPSALALEAAGVLDSILRKHAPTRLSDGFFDSDHQAIWSELTDGGWQLLALPDQSAGAPLDLVDLSAIAEVWGRYLIPLPYLPTLLVWHWSRAAGDSIEADKLTYSLPLSDPGTEGTAGMSPFAMSGGIKVVATVEEMTTYEPPPPSTDGSPGSGATGDLARTDPWAPSLPLARLPQTTHGLGMQAVHDVAVLGAAELVGCASAVIKITARYTKDRVQFGRPIAEYQAVQHRLADMLRDLELARTAVLWAANDDAKVLSATALAWDRVRRITENSFQLHGGYGFTWEAGLHYYSRHVWAWRELLEACSVKLWPL